MDKKRQEDYQQMIIERLKELSRNTAFDIPAEPNATKYYRDALYDACQLIKSLPPEHKKGQWISLDDFCGKYNEKGFKCSECGEHSDYEENFCPNCGVDMRKVK